MSALLTALFMFGIAFNAYRLAKRQGTWSWLQFGVVVAALILIPILIVVPVLSAPWLAGKPVLAALLATGLIILGVVAFCVALNRFWPRRKPTV